ncbi:NAD(P)-dependent oxidoreductase [Xinfangfangia pollutisoli]|uniref:NAD(P)-dependent oxidoreductase n=1 Tax=Xinfangfangia pollutisoli TaxID=2865960 RepID=UPI001CD5A858|nr:NAD(P)-dependent oxidoreductase [Xinfangfangia pollutisoli]
MTDAKILICDLVGLAPGPDGRPDASAVRAHIEKRGGAFHEGSARDLPAPSGQGPQFYYLPMLSTEAELLAEAGDGTYDAVIAAATFLPAGTRFAKGGVRIGAGTGNMGSASWGGGDGKGGTAPLMNTPGINARATAQMVMKALLRLRPDLPFDRLNALVSAGDFDTGRDLVRFPTAKLEGRVFAVIGYGNIGREVAKLARAFGMEVRIHARPRHRVWIESEGFTYAATPAEAARGADALSVHLGLGPMGPAGPANAGLIGAEVLGALARGAVLINFDRGELVDVPALGRALAAGTVGHAVIDADLFRDAETGALSGPMQPYLALLPDHAEKLTLLPHAAADTDHPTRVAGAIQAVDQILDAIDRHEIRNLKGDLPEGYRDAGSTRPSGMGGVTARQLAALQADATRFAALQTQARALVAGLDALADQGPEPAGEALMLAANRLAALLRETGLEGPFSDRG